MILFLSSAQQDLCSVTLIYHEVIRYFFVVHRDGDICGELRLRATDD